MNNGNKGNSRATASMIVGIIALVIACLSSFTVFIVMYGSDFSILWKEDIGILYGMFFFTPLVLSIISLVLSSSAVNMGCNVPNAKTGKILSIIAMLLCVVMIILATIKLSIAV